MAFEKGRRQGSAIEPKTNTIKPKSAEQGMLQNQDALIDAMKALAAKLDADSGVNDTDFASTITDALEKLSLR